MSGISAAQIQALADAVEWSRISEDIYIAFYCLYVYYFLTTLAEDVSIILPQKWNRGKIIYVLVRFGTLAFITLQLLRDYRSYFLFSPGACKALYFMTAASLYTVVLTCNLSLGLCLGALLRAKTLYLAAIVILSCGIPFVSAVIGLVSVIQYPAEPVPFPFDELGYSCYIPSPAQTASQTILSVGRDIRAYVNLVTTALLVLVGAVTLIVRYKGSGGHLIRVIRRDGGVLYLSLLAIRMAAAIIRTPAVVPASESDGNSAYPWVLHVMEMANDIIMPILAQRLLINMRKVDYMGSEPVASKLLFAAPTPGSDDDLEDDLNSSEMVARTSGLRYRGGGDDGADVREVGTVG